ncbi:MAG: transferase [Bacteroidetes bacterium]|nr:transferase [Bacteroidota bacterium]
MNKNLSYISEKAKIGNNVIIGNFCHIEDDVIIEDDVVIGNYSMIQKGSSIGSKTKIGTYTKIGVRCMIGKNCSFTSYCEIRDNCILGNNVSMGSRCTLSANTIVEDDVLMKYAFVVTDTPVLAKNEEKKTGKLKRGSKFGANVTIMPSVTIGENSEIGACSQVRNDVPDNEVWYGNPAKFYRKS